MNPAPTGSVSQSPAASSAFGLDGCCPVSLVEKQQWIPGDRRWGVNHRGRTYLFVGPEEQSRFFKDPDRYAPAVSGNDIVLATEQAQTVSGMREHGVFFGNRVYLFSSEATLEKFAKNPNLYANQALEALRSGAYPGRQMR
jgi:YHS domain-containing protein